MDKIKALSSACSSHKDRKVGFVCTKPDCKSKFLCCLCDGSHDKSHQKFVISILDLFYTDFEAETKEVLSQASQTSIDQAIKELDGYIDTISSDLLKALEQIRKEAHEKIRASDPKVLVETLEKLNEELISFSSMKDLKLEEVKDRVLDTYISFQDAKAKVISLKPESPYTYEANEKSIEAAKISIQKLLNTKISKAPINILSSTPWTWNQNLKSPMIIVEGSKLTVLDSEGELEGIHGIIGNTNFQNGIHHFNFEINLINEEMNPYTVFEDIDFGIVSGAVVLDIEDYTEFPTNRCISWHSHFDDGMPNNIRSLKVLCTLDIDQGIFRMWYNNGRELGRFGLEERSSSGYYPFIAFGCSASVNLTFEDNSIFYQRSQGGGLFGGRDNFMGGRGGGRGGQGGRGGRGGFQGQFRGRGGFGFHE